MDSNSRPVYSHSPCTALDTAGWRFHVAMSPVGLTLWNGAEGALKAAEQIKTEDVPNGEDSVRDTNLLSFEVGAPVVADGNLVDHGIQLRNFRCHFNFDAEPLGF